MSPLPPVPVLDGELRSLSAENVEEIAALDERAFGTRRQKLLSLLSEGASICTLSRGHETGLFADFLQQSRLGMNDTVITMSGRRFLNRKESEPWVYWLAGHALS